MTDNTKKLVTVANLSSDDFDVSTNEKLIKIKNKGTQVDESKFITKEWLKSALIKVTNQAGDVQFYAIDPDKVDQSGNLK